MPFRSSTARLLALLLLAEAAVAHAQIDSEGSPYSAYGLGDLLGTGHIPSALMGSTGIAYTEPFSVLSTNPASYAPARYRNSEGLVRPVFDTGVRGTFLRQRSENGSVRRSDGEFMGLSIGVPFGKGRWGLAFGLVPFSDVGYSLSESKPIEEGTVKYEYVGTGGLSRVYAGLGRILWQEKPDSLGNLGGRLAIGGNFDFLFGSIEQSRKAVYPFGQAYTSTSVFTSLVLRAPTGNFGLHYSDALTSKARVERTRIARMAKAQERVDRWKLDHVDTTRLSYDELTLWRAARTDEARLAWLRSIGWKTAYTDSADMPRVKALAESSPWRFTFGATAGLPTVFNASSSDLITSFFRGSTGVEVTIDTLPSNGKVKGTMTIPVAYGVGFSVHNAHWLITVEARRRDWNELKVDVEGYDLPSTLRPSAMYALGARFKPDDEGGLFQRATYRAGIRYTDDYLQVRGAALASTAFSAGVSLPLNAVQTDSHMHIGAEYGQRGTTSDGLLQENSVSLWIGVSITPWKRERWFQRYQIQ